MYHSLGQETRKGQEIGHPDSLTSAHIPDTGPSLGRAAQSPGHNRAPVPSPAPSPLTPHAVQPRVQSLPKGCVPHAGICCPYGAASKLHPHFPPLLSLHPPDSSSLHLLRSSAATGCGHPLTGPTALSRPWIGDTRVPKPASPLCSLETSQHTKGELGCSQHPSPVWHRALPAPGLSPPVLGD